MASFPLVVAVTAILTPAALPPGPADAGLAAVEGNAASIGSVGAARSRRAAALHRRGARLPGDRRVRPGLVGIGRDPRGLLGGPRGDQRDQRARERRHRRLPQFPLARALHLPAAGAVGGGPHPILFGPLLVAPDDSWQCNQRGLPGPFSINVQLYEDDECVKHPLSSSGPEFTFHIVIHRVQDGPRSPLPSARRSLPVGCPGVMPPLDTRSGRGQRPPVGRRRSSGTGSARTDVWSKA